MDGFVSMEQFKAAAEFFPKGRIIPQRILKGPRKVKHLWLFGGDAWAIPTPNGYVVAVDTEGDGSVIRGKLQRNLVYGAKSKPRTYTLQGSAYATNGDTAFVGNIGGDDAWLASLNETIGRKT